MTTLTMGRIDRLVAPDRGERLTDRSPTGRHAQVSMFDFTDIDERDLTIPAYMPDTARGRPPSQAHALRMVWTLQWGLFAVVALRVLLLP